MSRLTTRTIVVEGMSLCGAARTVTVEERRADLTLGDLTFVNSSPANASPTAPATTAPAPTRSPDGAAPIEKGTP